MLIGVGYLVYLLFSAASYALPMIAAFTVGIAAAHAGASSMGAVLLGSITFMVVIAVGRTATLLLPSRYARGAITLVFALPAAIAGYQVAVALAHLCGIGGWGLAVAAMAALMTAAVAARRHAVLRV